MYVRVFDNGPTCQACRLTKRALAKLQEEGATFQVVIVALQDDPEQAEAFRLLGHAQAPVVEVLDDDDNVLDRWSGMRPDKIRELVS